MIKNPAFQRKIIFLVILFIFLFFAYSRQEAKNISLDEIESAITESADLTDMKRCEDRDLMHFFDINPASTKGYFYYKGTDALSVDELVVIKGSGHNQLDVFRDAFESRIDNQIITFDGYGPKQVATLKDAVIIAKGPYILYYSGPLVDEIEEVFRHVV